MRRELLRNRPASWAAIVAVLALFVCGGSLRYRHADGQDLASSYVGSRLLAEGHARDLFSYDPQDFAEIGDDDTWTDVAHEGGFTGFLHPYVQTPLWGYMLEPLCRRISFSWFNHLFTVLNMLAFAGTLWLTAKYWARSFFNPLAIAVVAIALVLSQPFQYAMYLNQTHILFVFLTVAALILAERDWPVAAGLLLACATSVKVTPVLLVVYWLLTRRWKAALSTVVWSAVLWFLTQAAVGPALMHTYLAGLGRISRVLLLAQNNQSFAAWAMAHFYSPDEVYDINILPLPTALRLASSGLMLLFTAWGGWLDWRRRQVGVSIAEAPLGAMMAIIAATLFAPIAWTHYSIVLFMPFMLLIDANRAVQLRWVWLLIAVAMLLNYRPLATDIVHGLIGPFSLVRGQFYAGALTLLASASVATLQARARASSAATVAANGVLAE